MIKVTETNRDSIKQQDSLLMFQFYRNLCIVNRPLVDFIPRESNLKSIKYMELEDYCSRNNLTLIDVFDYCIETAYLDILSGEIECNGL